MDYIIVQAGGKGSRLKHLTKNKPKALVAVDNLPVIFHLFRKYPDKRFIVIADYKREVMHEYLEVFADTKYQVIDASGCGTCGGIKQSIDLIPENNPFMLIWSDLIIPMDFELPDEYKDSGAINRPERDYVGISKTFPCRWKYENGCFEEIESFEHGVAGFFLFTDKEKLRDIPENGEFVRWIQKEKMEFAEVELAGAREIGLIADYEKCAKEKCRPFNHMTLKGDHIIKKGIGEQGEELAGKECAWYENAREVGFSAIPEIYAFHPLEMELIKGKNIYEYHLCYEQKRMILQSVINVLQLLHTCKQMVPDHFSCRETYFYKTFSRIKKVRDLIPFANEKWIIINERKCRNVFFYKRELEKKLDNLSCDNFCFIHGDCTFSNIMLRGDKEPVLIDPRGYFGFTELFGDPLYDWAKLYYSVIGNYDQFNLNNFQLEIGEKEVHLRIVSNQWEDMEADFFSLTGTRPEDIKLLHAIIWLSFTTYAWHDYDSVCGAFYNGLYYLEEVL